MDIRTEQTIAPTAATEGRLVARKTHYNGWDIAALPVEIAVKILGHLGADDLLNCLHVSPRWRHVVVTSPVLAWAFCRSSCAPGFLPWANRALASYHASIRHWLMDFNQQGCEAVIRLDQVLAESRCYFPEQLLFAMTDLLEATRAFACNPVCTIKHADQIRQIGFSADEQHLATASDDCTVKILSCVGQQWQEATLPQSDKGHKFCFSANNKYLSTVAIDGNAQLWERVNNRWQKNADFVVFANNLPSFSAEATYLLVIARNQSADIYQLVDGQLRAMVFDTGSVDQGCFHPIDDHRLATGYHGTVTIWQWVNEHWQNQTILENNRFTNNVQFKCSPKISRLLIHREQADFPVCIWRQSNSVWQPEAMFWPSTWVENVYFGSTSLDSVYARAMNGLDNPHLAWHFAHGTWQKFPLPDPQRMCDLYGHCLSPEGEDLLDETDLESGAKYRNEQWFTEAAICRLQETAHPNFSWHGRDVILVADHQTVKICGHSDRGTWQEKACVPCSDPIDQAQFSPYGRYFFTQSTGTNTVALWMLTDRDNRAISLTNNQGTLLPGTNRE